MLDYLEQFIQDWKNFSGKMDRHSYWSAILSAVVIWGVLIWFGTKISFLKILPWLYLLIMVVPYFAATARRLHDTGRTTAFMLLFFIPVLGWICLFVELIQGSKPAAAEEFTDRV